MFIDTHAHLNFQAFADDWREVAEQAIAAGVEKMLVVGTDIETSRKAVELAQTHPALYASVGVHPHHARDVDLNIPALINQIRDLAVHPKVVAIGEIGLDYHLYRNSQYPEALLEVTPDYIDRQRRLLAAHIDLAQKLDKPVILHSREAKEDVLRLVGGYGRGTFHSFDGSKKYLKRILAAGFHVSLTGYITYNTDRAAVAGAIPLDRLLLETDCPYNTPFPRKGERNTPAGVIEVARKHALIRGVDLETIAHHTTQNAHQLFTLSGHN